MQTFHDKRTNRNSSIRYTVLFYQFIFSHKVSILVIYYCANDNKKESSWVLIPKIRLYFFFPQTHLKFTITWQFPHLSSSYLIVKQAIIAPVSFRVMFVNCNDWLSCIVPHSWNSLVWNVLNKFLSSAKNPRGLRKQETLATPFRGLDHLETMMILQPKTENMFNSFLVIIVIFHCRLVWITTDTYMLLFIQTKQV